MSFYFDKLAKVPGQAESDKVAFPPESLKGSITLF